MSQYYELYRSSSLGIALTETLDELINSGQINPQLAMKILSQFDRSVAETLNAQVKSRATFKGHLHTYRFCDDVWTFIIEKPTFRFENDVVMVDKVKIVACNAKKPGDN